MAEQEPKEQKWPWSVTDREFGALEQELKEIQRHNLEKMQRKICQNTDIICILPRHFKQEYAL